MMDTEYTSRPARRVGVGGSSIGASGMKDAGCGMGSFGEKGLDQLSPHFCHSLGSRSALNGLLTTILPLSATFDCSLKVMNA